MVGGTVVEVGRYAGSAPVQTDAVEAGSLARLTLLQLVCVALVETASDALKIVQKREA